MFKNAEGKVRSGWKIAAALGSVFVILMIVETILGVVLMVPLIGSLDLFSSDSFSSFYNALYDEIMEWAWLLYILQALIMIAVPVFTWKVILKRRLGDMGLTRLRVKELLWGLLLGAVSITAVFLLLMAFGVVRVVSWTPVPSADTYLYLVIFILVGISEEVFFRGYSVSALRQTRSIPVIFIASALVFALMHAANPGFNFSAFINIFIIGLLFTYTYMKSGNIWMPIGFHITWNYVQCSVFGLNTSGIGAKGLIDVVYTQTGFLGGGEFGPEDSLFSTVVALLCFLFVKWYYRKSTLDFLAMDGAPPVRPEP